MSSLREKLSRLKGLSSGAEKEARPVEEAPSAPPALESSEPEDGGAAAEPAAHSTVQAVTQTVTQATAQATAQAAANADIAAVIGGVPDDSLHPSFIKLGIVEESNAFGAFLLRRIEYPLEHRHGIYPLGALVDYAACLKPVAYRQNQARLDSEGQERMAPRKKKKLSVKDAYRLPLPEPEDTGKEPGAIEPGRLLFFDTETTGLGVGVGNVPFMIGFGYYDEGRARIVVEQTLIRHQGEEKAMLQYLLERMNGRTHLVTYNGRTFDWPVLTSRFILNGWRPNGTEPYHLDFLHPSRALWRNTLESCRLSRIEAERLGIERHEDVPGSLAPELYVRYLNDGDASHLEGVYLHNEQDVLTLVTLAAHFGALLADDPANEIAVPQAAEELYRTAAWLELHGRIEKSERLFSELAKRGDPHAERWLLPAADRYKKLGRYEQAVELWERAARKAEEAVVPSIAAHVELAMHYEHRSRNYRLAVDYAERALELTYRLPAFGRENPKRREERDALEHRLNRLRRKSERG